MKLTNLLLGLALAATTMSSACAQTLPQPQKQGGMPLMQAVNDRMSDRDLNPNVSITNQDLSNMLWAAWGITHDGKRTVATALNKQELDIYVITAKGIGRYNAEQNAIEEVASGDFSVLAGTQEFAQKAPLNIAFVANTDKQAQALFQGYAAGAASQNIYLYCASAGLKTVVRASFKAAELATAMKLGANQKILFVQSVSH